MKCLRLLAVLLGVMLPMPGTRAEILSTTPDAFSVSGSVSIAASSDEAFAAFVGKVGKWWDSSHTFFGAAENLSIEPKAQGCFCERSPSGGQAAHLTVIFVEPGKRIRLAGGLGPLQDQPVTGVMTVAFEPGEAGTKVSFVYRVSGAGVAGLEAWAAPVDKVLNEQFDRALKPS